MLMDTSAWVWIGLGPQSGNAQTSWEHLESGPCGSSLVQGGFNLISEQELFSRSVNYDEKGRRGLVIPSTPLAFPLHPPCSPVLPCTLLHSPLLPSALLCTSSGFSGDLPPVAAPISTPCHGGGDRAVQLWSFSLHNCGPTEALFCVHTPTSGTLW